MLATGNQVLLLNNDVVVTTGWLGRMLRALCSDPTSAWSGPARTSSAVHSRSRSVTTELAELDGFAWDWGKAHDRQTLDVHRLVGFCLLIKREVIDAIGPLDEHFGIGCFEDDDYCLCDRRRLSGRHRADAFVHHYGSRTFLGSGVDAGARCAKTIAGFKKNGRAMVLVLVPAQPVFLPPTVPPVWKGRLRGGRNSGRWRLS